MRPSSRSCCSSTSLTSISHLAAALQHRTCAAVAFPAGERRVESLVQQHVQQLGVAGPADGVGFAVELDDHCGRRLVAVALDNDRGERIGFQRLEHLDVDALRRRPDVLQRLLGRSHEWPRPADVRVVADVGRRKPGQRGRARQTLHRLQPVHDRQPVGVLGRQLAQRAAEDHRVLVAVGVDQHHLAAALGERGLADRHHRGDAAAGGQQQEVGVERLGDERARRSQHVHLHAGVRVVAQPIRRVPVDGPLDGHGHRVAGER